jgi:hypothetical protein
MQMGRRHDNDNPHSILGWLYDYNGRSVLGRHPSVVFHSIPDLIAE